MRPPSPAIVFAVAASTTAIALATMGQPLWCGEGDLAPWSARIASAHNSQHLLDPYSLTHVLHGILLYALVGALRRQPAGSTPGFAWAMGLEAAWEIIESTPFIVERYRAGTISLDYYGDSIANSVADLAACAIGYGLTAVLPVAVTMAAFVAVEALLLVWIRDSLLLNVIMLVRPLEAVRTWQVR